MPMLSGQCGRVPVSLEPHELQTRRLPTAGTGWLGPSLAGLISTNICVRLSEPDSNGYNGLAAACESFDRLSEQRAPSSLTLAAY